MSDGPAVDPSGAPPPPLPPLLSAPPTDTGWHRLHPATPLFRGGIILIVVLGFVAAQLRDSIVQLVAGGVIGQELPPDPQDPFDRWILEHAAIALAIVAALIVVVLLFGWLSWRMHEYRITDEIVEEREGVIARKHRRARLDRIQGVDVVRPLLPRIFGAARLDISVAGNDGNIRLAYLGSAQADRMKSDLLLAAGRARLAHQPPPPPPVAPDPATAFAPVPPGPDRLASAPLPGALIAPAPGAAGAVLGAGGVLDRRIQEFTAPELDDALAAPGSVVHMHPARLIGATFLDAVPIFIVLAVFIAGIEVAARSPIVLVTIIPVLIGLGSQLWRRVSRSLRYSIAATPAGIRIGFGLLSTTNETLPPGRIHAVEVSQPLLWRPFGWWRIRINRASTSARNGAEGQRSTTILPVGDVDDVARVVGLILPGLDVSGLLQGSTAEATPAFTTSPRRGAWFRWFSWRRNGFAHGGEAVLLRKGQLWRSLTLVPLARVQSVEIASGPLYRAARLRRVAVHTVHGVVRPRLGALDVADAERMWRETESATILAMEVAP